MHATVRLAQLAACFATVSLSAEARLGRVLYADSQSDATFVGDMEGDLLGGSQATGDLDGDGIDDLLLATWDSVRPGRIEILSGPILPGSRDLRSSPADISILGSALEARFGADGNIVLADMNMDGQLDVIVGAPDEALPGLGAGVVRILFGPFSPGTHAIDSLPGRRIYGPGLGFGHAIAVGDLSGDGVPDLAIGEIYGGRVHVLFGPMLDGLVLLGFTPADITLSAGLSLGHSVAISDVSGDGKPDLLVGEPQHDGRLGDRLDSGAIHVLHGPLPAGVVRDLRVDPADMTIHGARGGAPPFGDGGDVVGALVRVADLDLDGRPDIVTSGWWADGASGQEGAGMVTVVFGPFLASHVDLRDIPNEARIFGAEAEDALGWDVLLADVSGDGLPDLVAGAFDGGVGCSAGADPGVAHAFHAPIAPGLVVDLATEVSDLAITGTEPRARCCLSRDAADLDGDGTTDLVFSCYTADRPDGSAEDAGIVHILSPERAAAPLASPCCDAGAPTTVACDAPRRACGVDVQLDGSASRDAAGGVLAFEWEVACGAAITPAVGEMPIVCLDAAPGTTCTATLTVTSLEGLSTSCATTVAFDANAGPPELSGVPPDVVAACDAVPPVPIVSAIVDCESVVVPVEERREPGACEDSYTLIRTWRVTDAAGNVTEVSQEVAVSDTTAPMLVGVPAAIIVGCGALPAPAPVEARDACDPAPSLAMVETVVPGNCAQAVVRTWTARDRCGNEASASQSIEVRDEEPPVVAEGDAELAALWSPNHRMACLDASSLAPSIGEACSQPVSWRIVACSSDQPDDGRGDGATPDDCVVAPDGQSACVRAERAGGRQAGRRYALSIVATDGCGNESDATVIGFVRVPHDQRRQR